MTINEHDMKRIIASETKFRVDQFCPLEASLKNAITEIEISIKNHEKINKDYHQQIDRIKNNIRTNSDLIEYSKKKIDDINFLLKALQNKDK
jgi:hypothetical protein